MVTLNELAASSVATIVAMVGAPIMTLFGWVQIQLSGLKGDINKKASKEIVDQEVRSVKDELLVRHESIQSRLDNIDRGFDKIETKLDRIFDRLSKVEYTNGRPKT